MSSDCLIKSKNLTLQNLKIDRTLRASMNNLKPCVLWFTGFSGAGKSTIADLVEQELYARNKRTMLLDGDNIRHGLSKDLGFTKDDRIENIRRIAEVSKLMVDAGLITIVSLISPFRNERLMARELLKDGEFIEIFVDTPFSVCELRDPKGLYKKARAGQISNFTGIDSDYEPPVNPEIILNTVTCTPEELSNKVIEFLSIGRFI